jgi:hypothetical protein
LLLSDESFGVWFIEDEECSAVYYGLPLPIARRIGSRASALNSARPFLGFL